MNTHDDITHLLHKITWPQPTSDLAFRIANEVEGNNIPYVNYTGFFGFKSPLLSVVAVMLALILGVSSSFTTSGTAAADEYAHAYPTSSVSLTQIYAAKAGGEHE